MISITREGIDGSVELNFDDEYQVSGAAGLLGFYLVTKRHTENKDWWQLSRRRHEHAETFEGTFLEVRAYLIGYASRHVTARVTERKVEHIKAILG